METKELTLVEKMQRRRDLKNQLRELLENRNPADVYTVVKRQFVLDENGETKLVEREVQTTKAEEDLRLEIDNLKAEINHYSGDHWMNRHRVNELIAKAKVQYDEVISKGITDGLIEVKSYGLMFLSNGDVAFGSTPRWSTVEIEEQLKEAAGLYRREAAVLYSISGAMHSGQNKGFSTLTKDLRVIGAATGKEKSRIFPIHDEAPFIPGNPKPQGKNDLLSKLIRRRVNNK
ncbi:hypothetical protein [Pectobacterium phage vB_ParM-25]|nr:hypothetical protein [Serratia phage BUCT660]URG14250.1 hypothetical protein [Pectobacterium phage vB_ParM-25]